jgi:hypothetical protein
MTGGQASFLPYDGFDVEKAKNPTKTPKIATSGGSKTPIIF